MGVLDKMNDRLSGMISKLEQATSKSAVSAERVQDASGSRYGGNLTSAAMLGGNQKALDAAIKAETKARNAATRMLEAEAAEKKALIPQLKSEARLAAFKNRTEEQQARAYEAAKRLPGKGGAIAGMAARLMRYAAPAAGAYAIKGTADSLTGDMNLMQRGDLSQARRDQMYNESIPILGGFLRSLREFSEALRGTTEAVRQTMQNMNERRTEIGVREAGNTRIRGLELGVSRAEADVGATARNPLAPIQRFDQTTMEGRYAYEQYQQFRLPSQTAMTLSKRRAESARAAAIVATGNRLGLQRHFEQAHANELQARNRREAFNRGEMNLPPGLGDHALSVLTFGIRPAGPQVNRVADAETASGLTTSTAQLGASNTALQEGFRVEREANANAAREEAAARRDVTAAMEGELNILRQRASRMEGNAQGIGGMNPAERQQAVIAAQLISAHGIGNVPHELQGMLERAGPGAQRWLGLQREKFGEGSREYAQLQGLGIFESGTLAGVRGQRDTVQQNIQIQTDLNAGRLANEISKALSNDIHLLIDAIKVEIQHAIAEIRATVAVHNAQ